MRTDPPLALLAVCLSAALLLVACESEIPDEPGLGPSVAQDASGGADVEGPGKDTASTEDTGPPPACEVDSDCAVPEQPCLVAVCSAGACGSVPAADGGPCDDGDVCSQADACLDGACQGKAVVCEDGNACTDDHCHPVHGCEFLANGDLCSGPEPCGAYRCQAGSCQAANEAPCNDGNACTADGCEEATGCRWETLTGPACDDGDACTQGDSCQFGVCDGKAKACKDGNQCTLDSCDPATGCVFAPVPEGQLCSDGDGCTVGDQCQAGDCVGGPPKVCDDGDACTVDMCVPVGCKYVKAPKNACDDGDPCTSDGCHFLQGCQHTPVLGACG